MEERKLVVAELPRKRAWKPGETVSYEGVRVEVAGEDVTASCTFEPAEGFAWKKADKEVRVSVSAGTADPSAFTLKRKRGRLAPVLAALLAVAIAAGAAGAWWFASQPVQGDTGSYLIPKGGMTDEEAQALVDEMAEKSRITVSLAPKMRLADDGMLRVNLVVEEPNNGLSERLEVEQDGRVVYRSGIVTPGYTVEWGRADGAVPGPAVATVYAVRDGADTGNPVSVEVEIVDDGQDAAGQARAS